MQEMRNSKTRARTYKPNLKLGVCVSFINTHMFVAAITTRVPTTTTAVVTTALTNRPITCPQCGDKNKFGKSSCCGRGGSWFQKCGDPGESNFDHTWSDGIEACERKLMITFEINMY